MKKDRQRIFNLYKLAVHQELVLQRAGIIYRKNDEEGLFELITREAIYKIHPKQIVIQYRIGRCEQELIYSQKVFISLLRGIEAAFNKYRYKGRLMEQHRHIQKMIVTGFDLRKMY